MLKLNNILESTYISSKLDRAELRRKPLNESMKALNLEGKDCSKCSGLCCTSAHNSMLVTPLEALELYVYLERKNRINTELIDRLNQNIKEFRLDKELPVGSGRVFRRNYTCPFYMHEGLGCSVSPKHKPYGCLSFNSTVQGVSTSGYCKVYGNVIERREASYIEKENTANKSIQSELGLYWDKKNISSALMDLINLIKQ
jgi:Fe-S-cluster containining protein